MAGSLGDLTIDLNANIAKFLTAMDAAQLKSEKTASAIKSALIGGAAGLVGGASLGAIMKFVDSTIASTAALKDMGEKAGTSASQLSTLMTASKLSGTSMDTVTEGLIKLSKGLAGSEDMTGNAGRALKALGINARDAAGNLRDPAEVMKEMAAKLGEFKDGAGKTAIAIDAFGKSGAQLLPMLKEMYELGDQEVKVTDEQARAADDYEKGLKKLAATKQMMIKTVVMAAIPVMNDFVQALVDSSKQTDSMRNSVKDLAKDGTIKEWARDAAMGAAFVVDAFDGVARVVQIAGKWIGVAAAQAVFLAKGEFKAAADAGLEFGKDMDAILQKTLFSDTLKARFAQSDAGAGSTLAAKSLNYSNKNGPMATTGADPGKAFIDQLQRQLQQQEKGRFEMLRMEAAQKNVSAAAAPYISQLEEIQNRQERIKDTVAQVAESEKQRAKSLSLVTSGNDQAAGIIRETSMLGMQADARRKMIELRKVDAMVEQLSTDATIEQRIELQKLADVMKNNVAAAIDADIKKQKELNASWQVGAHDALTDYMNNVMDVAGQTKSAISSAFKGMEDSLVNFVKTGKMDFASLADSIISDLIRIEIQQSITGPLAAAMNSGGGIFSGITSMLGFAGGGNPPLNVPSIVGERGPELFVPRGAGTIIPNGAGGSGVVVNIVESPGNGGQQSRTTQNGVDVLTIMVEKVKSAIAGDISRGSGAVPNAMAATYGLNRVAGAY